MVKLRRGGGLSDHLEDRRGRGGLALGGGAVGIIGLLLTLLLGGGGGGGTDITDVFDQIQGGGSSGTVDPAEQPLVEEMSAALDDIQETWASDEGLGRSYVDATLVLYTDAVQTGGCGNAPSTVGPFYCPADSTAYLDLSFFQELADRFGAPGDFARVYVLAHELGHHVQHLLGSAGGEAGGGRGDANERSVRTELQADCYAGIWAHSAEDRGIIEPGDPDEGLAAAAAVGDDRLQEQAGQGIDPETWTHGSSASRQRWFRAGYASGRLEDCDTTSAPANQL
jgi:predicted metalloprotease